MADDGIGDLIANFIGVTGADNERARFYLHAANWDLNAAIAAFYDTADNDDEVDLPTTGHEKGTERGLSSTGGGGGVDTSNSQSSKQPTRHRDKSKFATLHDRQKSDSDGEEGQAFYAGGSETSGQQILGPKKERKDFTQSIFDAAKTHGAEVVTDSPQANSKRNASTFKGAGFTLGSNVDPSKQVGESLSDKTVLPRGGEPQNIVIKFWQNGFSVDNGPLRNPDDPANSDFMDSIKRGEVPEELRQHAHGGKVHVNMEDHRNEDYVKPKQPVKFFTGTGHTLGSPVPTIVEDNSLPPLSATNTLPSQPTFKIDESKPVTTIQIRLADGTRLITKFNLHNSVGDIKNVVRNSRPGQGNFNLMTTFPNKVLSNDNETIESAKLKNAVIVQRMT